MRQQQQAMREQQRAAREQARAQQRAAQEQARAAAQSRRATAPLGQSGQSGAEQNRPILGQEGQTAVPARGRREEVPSQRLREVQRQRQEQRQADRVVIREPDRRSIVRQNQHAFIRHDDNQRLARMVRAAQTARRGDTTALSFSSRNGARVFSEVDKEGHALRRYRRGRDGREIVLFDDRPFYAAGLAGLGASFVDLPPPVYELPPEQYVIDYSTASEDEIYTALTAPPIEPLARNYALEEIRQGYQLRERMRRIELVDINFEVGSWEISPEQYPKLERLARALNHILQEHPDEVFLIEGHADVLDSDIDNLTLSDRRAEAVAFILSQMFAVPAENLVTQGYGDEFLKADAGKINRRVSVRRITPLLRPQAAAVATSQPDALPAPAPAALDLSEDDRAFIAENLNYATEPGLGIGGISEGMRVPGGARLRSFPSIIRDRLPALATYRYFVSENEIAVVDPTRAEVVAVIEANR
jgi:outer membrane protein OmpA-like peptidoglycan-associated protein